MIPRFDQLLDYVEENGVLTEVAGQAGMDSVYHTAGFAALGRSGMLLNQQEADLELNKRVAELMKGGAEHLSESLNPTPLYDYMASVSAEVGGLLPTLKEMAQAGVNPSVGMLSEVVADLRTKVAVSNEQRALQRGGTTSGGGEGANDVDFKREGSQTQGYAEGVLDQHNATVKTILTTTIPSVGAMAKAVKGIGLASGQLDNRAGFVENRIKDLSNALASTTIKKVTGVKLDRTFESYIHAAKFSLFKSGSSLALEGPSIRLSGQLVTQQGSIVLTEADDIGVVGQWMTQQLKESWTLGTEHIQAVAKTRLVLTAGTAQYFGQSGITIGDKTKLTLGVDGKGGATFDAEGNITLVNSAKLGIKLSESGIVSIAADKGAQIQLNKEGTLTQQAKDSLVSKAKTVEVVGNTKVVIKVGGSSIVVDSSRIDLNPSSSPTVSDPASVSVEDVPVLDIVFVDPPKPAETPQKEATTLPAKGKRNPIPAPLPYKASS
jgi:hypothetical protein